MTDILIILFLGIIGPIHFYRLGKRDRQNPFSLTFQSIKDGLNAYDNSSDENVKIKLREELTNVRNLLREWVVEIDKRI